MTSPTARAFYAEWETYDRHIGEAVRNLTAEQLALEVAPRGWPIWATVGHMAGVRVYWICRVLGEPGAESTPFLDAAALDDGGWEDDLDHPRTADELVSALQSSWALIGGCLDRWSLQSLGQTVVRESGGVRREHTRRSILLRLLSHDAYHAGELSLVLGSHGLPQVDLWPPDDESVR